MPIDPPKLAFGWIASVQSEGQPFPVTIIALDAQGQRLSLNATAQLYSPAVVVNPDPGATLANGTCSGLGDRPWGRQRGHPGSVSAQGMTGTSASFAVSGPGSQAAYVSGKVTDLTGTPF